MNTPEEGRFALDAATSLPGAGPGVGPTRRAFLRLATRGALVLSLAAPIVLDACVPPTPARVPTTAPSSNGVTWPASVAFNGPRPDLPGTAQGVAPGFFRYPQPLVKSVPSPPGKGGDVTIYTVIAVGGTPPPPLEQNPTWQQLNTELNVNLKLNAATNTTDAAAKIATLVAGGDLPDIIYLGPSTSSGLTHLPEFLEARCEDLTPFLSGDAVKRFANLAAFPPFVWRGNGIVYNQKIFGVPVARNIANTALMVRQDLLDQAGVGPITTADDFKKALQATTRTGSGSYGIVESGGVGGTTALAAALFGAPNNWKLAAGKLVKDYETEEYRAALGYVRELYAAGVYHPSSLTGNTATAQNAFLSGQAAFLSFLETSVDFFWPRMPSGARLSIVPPFSVDGKAPPQYFLGGGNVGVSVIRKATPDRVNELLGVLNYIAAPFGSSEKLLTSYGLKDVDYTVDANGSPSPTPNGYYLHPVPLTLVASGIPALYNPVNSKEYATLLHDFESVAIPLGVQDATLGLFSASNGSLGPAIRQPVTDAIADIVTGRQPLSNWDQVVQDWRARGGDTIRSEFQQALHR